MTNSANLIDKKYLRKNRYWLIVLGVASVILAFHNLWELLNIENYVPFRIVWDITVIVIEFTLGWILFSSFRSYLHISQHGIQIREYWGHMDVAWQEIEDYIPESTGSKSSLLKLKNLPETDSKLRHWLMRIFVTDKKTISLSRFLTEQDMNIVNDLIKERISVQSHNS